jgi:acetate kinase
MNVLVFNCGSSSQNFKVYRVGDGAEPTVVAAGKASNVATATRAAARIDWKVGGDEGGQEADLSTHRRAAQESLRILAEHGVELDAIGHRFVHGGERFDESALITPGVAETLKQCFGLAPIHNPNSFSVIEACTQQLPLVPQVAVFDTAFHSRLPEEAKRYALPLELSRKYGFRKYGFHGLSYAYVSERSAELLGKPIDSVKLVMCHLGTGGSSVTAFAQGHSVDTSLGYSPLPGLVMSTRCGDIDAEVVLELCRHGYSADDVGEILIKRSGLIGLSGFSSNLEEVIAEGERGNEDCRIAAGVYANRLKTYLGGYYWLLGGADAIVFTDSVGTRSWKLREKVCSGVESLGVLLDAGRNREAPADAESFVSRPGSRTAIMVVPTDEELVIMREVLRKL